MPAHSLGGQSAWAVTTHTDQQISGKKEFLSDTAFAGDADFAGDATILGDAVLSDTTIQGESIFSGPVDFSPTNLFPTQYEPAGTNFVTNPSFEINTAGWEVVNGGSLARVASEGGMFGSFRLQDTLGAGANDYGVRTVVFGLEGGTEYVFSAWVRVDNASNDKVRMQIDWNVGGGTVAMIAADYSVPTSGNAARISFRGIAPKGVDNAHIYFRNNSTDKGAGSVMLIDGVQFEAGGQPTSYIDGTRGAGFAWSGTAHASTSTRAGNTVAVAITDVASTNLIPDPSFKRGIEDWTTGRSGTNIAISYNLNEGRVGKGCLQVRSAVGGTVLRRALGPKISVSPGQVVAFSVWVKGTPGQKVVIDLLYYTAANGLLGGSGSTAATAGFRMTGEWQRIHGLSGPAYANTSNVQLEVGPDNDAPNGQIVFADGAQVEISNAPTSYIDGSLGEGYSWTGTPHASSSTRAAGTVISSQVKAFSGHGAVTESAGKNCCPNPSFEIDTSHWKVYQSNISGTTLTRATGMSTSGAASMAIWQPTAGTASAQAGAEGVAWEPAGPGETFTLSATLTSNIAVNEYLYIYEYDGNKNYLATTKFELFPLDPGVSRRVSITGTTTNAGTKFVGALIASGVAAPSANILVDAVQLERGSSPTSYIDGSLGPGYSWEGTPHSSPSYRTPGVKMGAPSGGLYTKRPSCRVYQNSTVSATSGTYTLMTWTAAYENMPMFSSGSRVVIPEEGLYLVSFNLRWNGATGGTYRAITINKNGGTIATNWQQAPTINAPLPTNSLTDVSHCRPGDYFEFFVYQDSGAALTTYGFAETATFASVTKIGDR